MIEKRPRPPLWRLLGLILALAFLCWLRGYTSAPWTGKTASWGKAAYPWASGRSEPLDCDESAYAYMGRRIGDGAVLYRDVSEFKPPLGYWIYAAAVRLGGADETAIRLTAYPFVAISLAGLWYLALRLSGPIAATITAWWWVIASTDPYIFGNGSNMEHFMNAFAVVTMVLCVRTLLDGGGPCAWFFVGVALGAETLVKQVAAVQLPIYLYAAWRTQGRAAAVGLFAGWASALIAAAAILFAQGAAQDAWDDVLRYGPALAADTPASPNQPPGAIRWWTGNADPTPNAPPWSRGGLPAPWAWPMFSLPPQAHTTYYVWWGWGSWPLWLAVPLGTIVLAASFGRTLIRKHQEPTASEDNRIFARGFLPLWFLSRGAAVILPGLYWPHYYLLPVPAAVLIAGIACGTLCDYAAQNIRGKTSPVRAGFAGLLALGLCLLLMTQTVLLVRSYLLVPPEEVTKRYKGGAQWIALRDLGRDLDHRVRGWNPRPRLFVWGWQSPLFLYGKLDGVSRHFFVDPLMQATAGDDENPCRHPLVIPRLETILRDITAERPEFLFCGNPPFPQLRDHLQRHYRPASFQPVAPDGRGLWLRSDVADRLEGR